MSQVDRTCISKRYKKSQKNTVNILILFHILMGAFKKNVTRALVKLFVLILLLVSTGILNVFLCFLDV